MKYQRFSPSCCKDIGIIKFEFVANTQFLYIKRTRTKVEFKTIWLLYIYFILHTKQGILNTYWKTHFLNKQFSDLQLLSILLLRRLKKTMHQLIVFFTSCHVYFYAYLTLNSCTFESELNPPLRSELVLPRPVHQLHWQGSL